MRNTNNIKSLLLQATFASSILFGLSAFSHNITADAKDLTGENDTIKFEETEEKGSAFLVNAAEINLEEISLAKLAQQKGVSIHVKELGKSMQDRHQKSLNDLIGLANTKMITIPTLVTDKGNAEYKNLNEKLSKDFDKAYADLMVVKHQEAIAIFEKAATESTDSDIRAWAAASIPDLRSHLDQALTCQKLCEKITLK